MATELTERVFAAVDAEDTATFIEFFSDTGRFVFGNGEPLVGHDAIADGVGRFLDTIGGLRHEVVNEWVTGPDTVVELKVTYERLDGRSVSVPGVTIFHLDQAGLIDHYRIFIDLAPVYAP